METCYKFLSSLKKPADVKKNYIGRPRGSTLQDEYGRGESRMMPKGRSKRGELTARFIIPAQPTVTWVHG